MIKQTGERRITWIIVLLVTLQLTRMACAQPPDNQSRDTVLWQARSCVGEVGWDDRQTCIAMTYVHMKRARRHGVPLVWMILQYSSPVSTRAVRRSWVQHLRMDTRRGSHWPARLPWLRSWRQFHWSASIKLVQEVYAGMHEDPCPDAIHYGSRRYDRVMDPSRFYEVQCLPGSGQIMYGRIER
jgi:hypothetical protein